MPEWTADVLGDEFEQLTLSLGKDREGLVVATLVRALPQEPSWWRRGHREHDLGDVDVLYVHGWSDYFFQKRLARFWTSRGARFYALDLRKYGRSIREGQTPGYITDLATYDEDIAAALGAMGRSVDGVKPDRRLVLFGHSTGGLILSLWASRHQDTADAVILNSPWLAFQVASARALVASVAEIQARWAPRDVAPQVDLGFYTKAQLAVADPTDPMTVNLAWRPAQAMTIHAGWFRAILAGHSAVASGLAIPAPVCVLLSARSVAASRWSDELTRADSVLAVDRVARASLKLGSSVTVERIDGALHDVFLSRHVSREEAYRRLDRWVTGWSIGGRRHT